MPIASTVASQFRKLVSRESEEAAARRASAQVRQAARAMRSGNSVLGKDVLDLGVKQMPSTPAALAAKRGKVVPLAQRAVVNHEIGKQREEAAVKLVRQLYPRNEGYRVVREQYLRDRLGSIAHDLENKSRRLDIVVFKDDEVVRSIEVTGADVDKRAQLKKEAEILKAGGRYLMSPGTRKLVRIPSSVKTTVVRIE